MGLSNEREGFEDSTRQEPEPIDIAGEQREQGLVHEPDDFDDEDVLGDDDDEEYEDEDEEDFEEGHLGEDDED